MLQQSREVNGVDARLDKIETDVSAVKETLKEHTEILEAHTETLDEHTEALNALIEWTEETAVTIRVPFAKAQPSQ